MCERVPPLSSLSHPPLPPPTPTLLSPYTGGETVKAPGNLVVSAYVTVPDITIKTTPDLKLPGHGKLLHVDLGQGQKRLGGSSLAQVLNQVGDQSPDVDPVVLKRAFETTQQLLGEGKIHAGHDVSDGGLVTTVLEMAFAGNCGVELSLVSGGEGPWGALFAEELGLVLEVAPGDEAAVQQAYEAAGVPCAVIGSTTDTGTVSVRVDGHVAVHGTTAGLRDVWEATSFELEKRQAAEECVAQEQAGLATRQAPVWKLPFTPTWTPDEVMTATDKPRVAIVREEGSNGDREMAAAVHAAGMLFLEGEVYAVYVCLSTCVHMLLYTLLCTRNIQHCTPFHIIPHSISYTSPPLSHHPLSHTHTHSHTHIHTPSHSPAHTHTGMEPWDITMSDLLNGRATLDTFRGIVFVGGFSYADVLDSAKGWAGTIRFNEQVWNQFQEV